jgi:drug/metabolite transporter (DMT)-like permease
MSSHRTDVALLGVAAAWGSSYLASKEIATSATVFAVLALRFTLATVVLAAVLALGRRLCGLTADDMVAGVVGGLILSAVCICETYGVTQTSASNAGLIMALTIVATPILQRYAVPLRFYLAAMLAVLGCGMLAQSGGPLSLRSGDLLIVAAALLRAVHVVVLSRVADSRETDTVRRTLVQLVTVAVVASVLAGATGQSAYALASTMGPPEWALIGYLAVVCTVFAFLIQLRALGATSPARVSLVLGTEPLWAAAIGVTLAGDPVSGVSCVGAVLVVAGTWWGRTLLTGISGVPTPDRRHGPRGSRRHRRSGDRRTAPDSAGRRSCSP